jgi:hypothetical protein
MELRLALSGSFGYWVISQIYIKPSNGFRLQGENKSYPGTQYLQDRRSHYYQAEGIPIGSGTVESTVKQIGTPD